jgi:pterin-4a-carbinolamine dehydratase
MNYINGLLTKKPKIEFENKEPALSSHKKLKHRELIDVLRKLQFWSGATYKRPYLKRDFQFANGDIALKFVQSVAVVAKEMNHYPKVTLYKSRVGVVLRTYEVDGISTRDIELAFKVDAVGLAAL